MCPLVKPSLPITMPLIYGDPFWELFVQCLAFPTLHLLHVFWSIFLSREFLVVSSNCNWVVPSSSCLEYRQPLRYWSCSNTMEHSLFSCFAVIAQFHSHFRREIKCWTVGLGQGTSLTVDTMTSGYCCPEPNGRAFWSWAFTQSSLKDCICLNSAHMIALLKKLWPTFHFGFGPIWDKCA